MNMRVPFSAVDLSMDLSAAFYVCLMFGEERDMFVFKVVTTTLVIAFFAVMGFIFPKLDKVERGTLMLFVTLYIMCLVGMWF